ncbi:substrate-binding domain-containing protein [Planctomycetaceae bacterium SH139]
MKKQVALIIETSSSYGRNLLAGIVRFKRVRDDWSVFLEQRDLTQEPPAWLASWSGDGIISRATTPDLIAAIQSTGIPLVELTDRRVDSGLPLVRSDDAAIGRMAAEHLLERGFRHFGFCGFSKEAWSHRRQIAFAARVAAAGFQCHCLESHWVGPKAKPWEDEQQLLIEWLRSQTRPCGLMACNDIRGQHLLDACAKVGYAVPEEVAVIGVDNDEILCQISAPPLSSVIPNAEGVGFRAAELLSALMARTEPSQLVHILEPRGVATRQSTDVVAIDDPAIAMALHFIRQHACRNISVRDVVEHCAVSRSTLERQFRKLLGRTPQQEIRNAQVKRVRELLATTELSTEQIAALCGFEHPEYLHVVFKRMTGTTPGEYRRQTNP